MAGMLVAFGLQRIHLNLLVFLVVLLMDVLSERYVDRVFATLRACFPVESKNDEEQMLLQSYPWLQDCLKFKLFHVLWLAICALGVVAQEWYDIHCRHQTASNRVKSERKEF